MIFNEDKLWYPKRVRPEMKGLGEMMTLKEVVLMQTYSVGLRVGKVIKLRAEGINPERGLIRRKEFSVFFNAPKLFEFEEKKGNKDDEAV